MAASRGISLLRLPCSRLLQIPAIQRVPQHPAVCTKIPFSRLSTSALLLGDDTSKALKDPKQITLEDAAKTVTELEHDAALKGLITVEGAPDITAVSVCLFSHFRHNSMHTLRELNLFLFIFGYHVPI